MRLFVVLLVVFFTYPVVAQEGTGKIDGWPSAFEGRHPVGMPPGEGWKVVSGDGTLLTSDCIGVFTSPECVLDTVLACEAWSRVDEVTAVDSYGYEDHWHPICDSLRGQPGNVDSPVRTFGAGSDNPEDYSYYYKTVPFVVTTGNVPPRDAPPYPEGSSCRVCPGDVAVAFPTIICSPDPAIIGLERDGWAFGEYPDDSFISYCVEWITDFALIVRIDDRTGLWSIVEPYRPSLDGGSGHPEGWPYLDRIYQGIR